MSKKIRVTQKLIEKAMRAFESSGKKGMVVGKGLSRTELRSLERKGLVRRMSTFGSTKFVNYRGSVSYLWFWIGE